MKVFIVSERVLHEDERVAAVFDSYEKAQHFVEDHTTDESWRVSHDIEEWEVM
jgi:hypothetical protein